MSVGPASLRRPRAALLALLLTLLALYSPVVHYDFTDFDDDGYVSRNDSLRVGLTWDGVRWAFGNTRMANWHPLTWLSWLVDYELYGLEPGGYHLTNVLLHAANTALLYAALRRLTREAWKSLLVAALFALHPLHVESVAWISERKDVLAGTFWMLGLLSYARYAEKPSAVRYGAVALCLALGLLAKPMGVTFPLVLLLLDAWPLGRFAGSASPRAKARRLARLAFEKLPLLVLSAVSSVITLRVQERALDDRIGFGWRVANAALAYVAYLRKALWPSDLAPMYPHAHERLALVLALAAATALGLATLLALRSYRRRPYLVVGWLWYLGTLIPVIGLVQVGRQAMADRYAYLPLIGIYLCVAWGGGDVARALSLRREVRDGVALLALASLALVSSGQLGVWRDSETLYERAIEVSPLDDWGRFRLGTLVHASGRAEESVGHLTEAVRLGPDRHWARVELGLVLAELSRLPEAEEQLRAAVALRPEEAQAHSNLGNVLARQNRLDEAIACFERALALRPELTETRLSLALALALSGRADEARVHATRAIEEAPDHPLVRELRARLGSEGAGVE